MDKKISKVFKVVGTSILLVGVGALVSHEAFPKVVTHEIVKEVPVEKIVTKEIKVEVPVEKIVTKEVNVTDGRFEDFVNFIWKEDGNVNFMTNDLKEKEAMKIADRYVQVLDFQNSAVSEVKDKIFDKLDDKTVNGTNLHSKKMTNLKIYDDFTDLTVSDIDFETKDATVKVTGKFKYDDTDKYNFEALVYFNNGDYDSIEVTSIVKE